MEAEKATREEVEKLKADWLKDPSWDIEETDGFEEYKDELKSFREEQEKGWEDKAEARYRRKCNMLYNMRLGEFLFLADDFCMRRVPGGWVASIMSEDAVPATVFIPFNNEFRGAHNGQ